MTPFRTLSCALALALLAHQPLAHAYIDPATGSLIIQGLVAFFVGAAFAVKTFFREKIKPVVDWILRRPQQDRSAEPPVDAAKN